MTVLGNRNAQRQAHEPVEGLPVYDEPIRSPQDLSVPIAWIGGVPVQWLVLHPISPETAYVFVELPGGPAASAVLPGPIVSMTYDPGVTTDAVLAAAVLADPASALLLAIINTTGALIPAGLGGTGGNLWSDLIAVPGAMFRRDPVTGRFVPWDGAIVGGAAMLAAMLAIQANTAPDNRVDPQTIDLTGARVDVALGLAGRNLNILNLTGAASIRLVNGGVPYPTLPDPAMDIFPLDRFNFDFTDVLLSNGAQPGMWLTLAAMWRV
jgi:hypothetical protein